MILGYVVRPKADRDIGDISDYITEHGSLDMALLFLSEMYETLALIASQPAIGWPCKVNVPQLQGARTFRVSERFADYLIFYRRFENRIEILRVLHGARDLEGLFGQGDV